MAEKADFDGDSGDSDDDEDYTGEGADTLRDGGKERQERSDGDATEEDEWNEQATEKMANENIDGGDGDGAGDGTATGRVSLSKKRNKRAGRRERAGSRGNKRVRPWTEAVRTE